MIETVIEQWHQHLRGKLPGGLDELLHDDVVFYSPIVYTPQAIVDFMCGSVEEVLRSEFALGLGSSGVNFLDPCTGTGNFIVNLLRRISPRQVIFSQIIWRRRTERRGAGSSS